MVVVQALMSSLLGAFSLTCTGWNIDSNSKILLGVRVLGYLGCAWAAVLAVVKHRYLESACFLVATGLFYMWLETGWLFTQPAFGPPSKIAMVPLLVALVVLLAPHSPTLNQPGPQDPAT
jgi:hypothetical protein